MYNYNDILAKFDADKTHSKSSLTADEIAFLYQTIDGKLQEKTSQVEKRVGTLDPVFKIGAGSLPAGLDVMETAFIGWYRNLLAKFEDPNKQPDDRETEIVRVVVLGMGVDKCRLVAEETCIYALAAQMYARIDQKLKDNASLCKVGSGDVLPDFKLKIEETCFVGWYRNMLADTVGGRNKYGLNVVQNLIQESHLPCDRLVADETVIISTLRPH